MLLTRRRFLNTAALGAAGLALSSPAALSAASPRRAQNAAPAEFAFSTWGTWQFYYDAFQRMQKAYPQYRPVHFKNEQSPSSDVTLQRLLDGWVARAWNSMPDVAEVDPRMVAQLASAGILVDLTDRFKPFAKDIAPSVLEDVTWNGRIWACPWMPNTAMIYYRHDVWSEAGVKADQIKLWSDFLAAGKQVTNHKYRDGKKRYMTYMGASTVSFNYDLVTQQGGALFDRKTGDVLIDKDPRFRRAFATQVDWVRQGIAIRMNDFATPWYHALAEGIISCYVAEDWMDQILRQEMPQTSGTWRTMAYPAFTPGGSRAAIGGPAVVVAINKPSLDHELAWTFMQHSFYNLQVTPALYNTWHLVPAYLAAARSPAFVYNRPSPFYGGQNQGALDAAIAQHAFAPYYTPNFTMLLNNINTEMAKAMAGNESVDTAIKNAANQTRQNM